MGLLSMEQKDRAVQAMREYLSSSEAVAASGKLDNERGGVIGEFLGPLLQQYLADKVPLAKFKLDVDSTNKRHRLWGFSGIKGQMFFNMLLKASADEADCDQELKAAFQLPGSDEMAKSRMRNFLSYVKRIGSELAEHGGSAYACPKVSSVPFFVSYFWQLQDPEQWPVYYTNSVEILQKLNLWEPDEDFAKSYIEFKQIHDELRELFSEAGARRFSFYDIEHVFWFKSGRAIGATASQEVTDAQPAPIIRPGVSVIHDEDPLDTYVPPVVSTLPGLARNLESLVRLATAAGLSGERAMEKGVNAAFTILGYQTQLLGQGSGRVPDGTAVDVDNSYGIIWDAKIRRDGYAMGTDDRAIAEYIRGQSRELMRRRSLRNIYYAIVSSQFHDDYDDEARDLKMETGVNEVILLEAAAIVAMVDARLRDPVQVTLGPDGLQRLFCSSGIVTAENVRDVLN